MQHLVTFLHSFPSYLLTHPLVAGGLGAAYAVAIGGTLWSFTRVGR